MPTSSFLPLLFFFLLLFRNFVVSFAGANISTEIIYPNFTATYLLFFDTQGIFLASPDGTFVVGMVNPDGQQYRFYLSIEHSPTSTVVWTANRDVPVSNGGTVHLTSAGFTLSQPDGSVVWSTPKFSSPVHALRLLDTGNLLVVDASNTTLWQSFDHPTDTLVPGQVLNAGSTLVGSINDSYPAAGYYSFTVTDGDAYMTWENSGQIYWSMSTDLRAFQVYGGSVAYMATNASGLYLFSSGGLAVFQVSLPPADLRFMKMGSDGLLRVLSYSAANAASGLVEDFAAPTGNCDLPSPCMTLGLCTASGNSSTCSCPPPLATSAAGGCAPADGSTLASSNSTSCNASSTSSTSYITLGSGISYFAITLARPITSAGNMSACQSLCTGNCSCLAFFYKSSTKSCFIVENILGSLYRVTSNDPISTTGYIKTLVSASSPPSASGTSNKHLVAILSPSFALLLFVIVAGVMGILLWRRKKSSNMRRTSMKDIKLGRRSSAAAGAGADDKDDDLENEEDDILGELIPGLPTRFTYAELEDATNSFRVKVGSGGFGSVYKGELPDKSIIAVKKIENIGVQGKREFCTEIGIIGNIHHVNLVRLRGFCAQGTKRLLVYEFMNRGSLDRSLFGSGPPLEWQERVDIAIGAARGLAYLHSSCNPKIIHCDVKPENILLHDTGPAKIADFGLAKLLSAEQSGLFTTMRGTRGYLAPEWLTNSLISDRTDVYSFGMVLLELVRGRKNRSSRIEDGSNLSTSSNDSGVSKGGYFPLVALEGHEDGKYLELADPRLEGRVTEEEVERMVKVALCCLHEEPPLRPNMMAVAAMLEGSLDVWEPRVESLNFMRLYGKRFVDPMVSGGDREKVPFTGSKDTTWLLDWPANSSTLPSYISSQQISGPR